jgi:hypothetical protein
LAGLPDYFVFSEAVMRGGWRIGAGRPAQHGKVEYRHRIDVQRWAREGLLTDGKYFGWQWRENGQEVASIGVRVNSSDMITLTYRWQHNEEWHDESFQIRLVNTACNYGGRCVWFACPHCGKRFAHLYLASGRWLCRKSLKLVYVSQSEDGLDRLQRKKNKLEKRLG